MNQKQDVMSKDETVKGKNAKAYLVLLATRATVCCPLQFGRGVRTIVSLQLFVFNGGIPATDSFTHFISSKGYAKYVKKAVQSSCDHILDSMLKYECEHQDKCIQTKRAKRTKLQVENTFLITLLLLKPTSRI